MLQVGPTDHVICALSGGVDSTVAATLVHKVGAPLPVSSTRPAHGCRAAARHLMLPAHPAACPAPPAASSLAGLLLLPPVSCPAPAPGPQVLGDRLHCVFVDNGLLRYKEAERVMDTFNQHLHLPVTKVDDAGERRAG